MLCLDCFLNWSFCSFHHFKILSTLKWFVEENFGTFYYSPHEYLPWDRDIAKEGFLWPEKEESIKYWRKVPVSMIEGTLWKTGKIPPVLRKMNTCQLMEDRSSEKRLSSQPKLTLYCSDNWWWWLCKEDSLLK